MRALLDGVFEAEEVFQEVENDEEFEDKGGPTVLSRPHSDARDLLVPT